MSAFVDQFKVPVVGRDEPAGGGPSRLPPAVSFTVPTPPSANHLFKNVKGVGRVKTRHYEDFVYMAVAAIRRQNVASIPGRVIMVLGVERMSDLADIDNRIKALFDAIAQAGVIENDRLVTAFAIAWMPLANGITHLMVLPVQKLTLTFHPSQNGASGGWFLNAPFQQEEEGHGDLAS